MKKSFNMFYVIASVALTSAAFAQTETSDKTVYTIGYFDTPPLSFFNEELSQADGFAVDLMNQIAVLNNFTIKWQFDDFPNLLEQAKNKQIDGLINTGYSDERAEFLSYSSTNFANVWGQVYLPANSNIETIFDLENKVVAIMTNDVNGINFISQCDVFEVNCKYIYENNYTDIFTKLEAGQIDAAVSNNLVGNIYQKDSSILASSIIFDPFKVYIAVSKNTNKSLLDMYDKTILEWKRNPNSYYYQSRFKWTSPPSDNIIPNWIWFSIFGLMAFGFIAVYTALWLKKQVNRRIEELSERETQLNEIINAVPHMIYANNENGQLILANDTARQLFGIEDNFNKSQNIFQILNAHSGYKNLITYNQSTNPFDTEIEISDQLGTSRNMMMSKVPFTVGKKAEAAVVTVGVDVSQLKAYEKEILYLAKYDALTNLPNRELLKDRLKSSLTRAVQYNHVGGILHVDIDNFKNINDSKGHKTGDELIKKVALRIKSCANPGDTIARLSGDEFIIELPELTNDLEKAESQAIEMAQKALEKIKQPIDVNNEHFNITASVGLVIYPKDGTSHTTLLQRAETAMFEAKRRGRNRIQVFNQSIESKVMKNHQLENDLRVALKNNEISIVYQPIVNAKHGQMVGSEMLLRWSHPTEGQIMPGDFIPIAEQSQLILKIGYWAIEEACKQIVTWMKVAKNPFFIAVNLSVIQIREPDFLKKVTELIHSYNIPHGYLEFEMTESILLTESKRSLEMIKQLKLLGVKLSIDDFGTGYASFDYIRKLPLDKIKVDKSFIQDIPENNNSSTIVKTILSMAEEMNLEVVAEGVENQKQIDFLKLHHCQYFQGYYFAMPEKESNLNFKNNF